MRNAPLPENIVWAEEISFNACGMQWREMRGGAKLV